MLNPTQHHILCSYFDDLFDEAIFHAGDVQTLHPNNVILVLDQLLRHVVEKQPMPDETVDAIEHEDFRSTVQEILKILRHECPQNRTASSVQVPQNDQDLDLGFVYFRDESSGKELLREKRGLLGLTARNDEKYKPSVDRDDVRAFVRDRIQQELRVQRARLAVCHHVDTKLAELKNHNAQEEEFRNLIGRIDTTIVSCQIDAAMNLLSGVSAAAVSKAKHQTKDTLLLACSALARNSLLHHLQGEEEEALSDMQLLQHIAASASCKSIDVDVAFVSRFQIEFQASKLLKLDIQQLNADALKDVLDKLPEDHASRGNLMLKLACVLERTGQHTEAVEALRSAIELLSSSSVASLTEGLYVKLAQQRTASTSSQLEEIRDKLAGATPPSLLARHHLMKERYRQGLLNYDHKIDLIDIIKSTTIDMSIRFEAMELFYNTEKGLPFFASYSELEAAFEQILLAKEELSKIESSTLLDTVQLMYKSEDKLALRFIDAVLQRNDRTRPRALFLKSFCCGKDQRLEYIKQALQCGWNHVDCKTRIAELVGTHSQEVLEEALALLPEMDLENTVCTLVALHKNAMSEKGIPFESALSITRKSFSEYGDFIDVPGRFATEATELHIAFLHLLCLHGEIDQAKLHTQKFEAFLDRYQDCDPDDGGAIHSLYDYTLHGALDDAWKHLLKHEELEGSYLLFMQQQHHYPLHSCELAFIQQLCDRRKDASPALLSDIEQYIRKGLSELSDMQEALVAIAHLCVFQNKNEEAAAALDSLDTSKQTVYLRHSRLCLCAIISRRLGNNKKAMKDFDEFLGHFLSYHACTFKLVEVKLLLIEIGDLLLKQAKTLASSEQCANRIVKMVLHYNKQFPDDYCHVLQRNLAEAHYILYKTNGQTKRLQWAVERMERVVDSKLSTGTVMDSDLFLFSDMLIDAKEFSRALEVLQRCSSQIDEARVRIVKVQMEEFSQSDVSESESNAKLVAICESIQQLTAQQPSQAKKLLKQLKAIEKEKQVKVLSPDMQPVHATQALSLSQIFPKNRSSCFKWKDCALRLLCKSFPRLTAPRTTQRQSHVSASKKELRHIAATACQEVAKYLQLMQQTFLCRQIRHTRSIVNSVPACELVALSTPIYEFHFQHGPLCSRRLCLAAVTHAVMRKQKRILLQSSSWFVVQTATATRERTEHGEANIFLPDFASLLQPIRDWKTTP